MYSLDHQRLLALDVHPRRLGYAVFEGPERLLDWQVKSFRGGVNAVRVPFGIKVERLLSEWHPHMVVVERPNGGRVGQKMKAIQRRAKTLRIGVRFVKPDAVNDAFPSLSNKHERARLLAATFPELAERLPPRRKPWQSEHYQMSIFDAVVLGVAYFKNHSFTIEGSDEIKR